MSCPGVSACSTTPSYGWAGTCPPPTAPPRQARRRPPRSTRWTHGCGGADEPAHRRFSTAKGLPRWRGVPAGQARGAISTRASLKQAPAPRSVRVSGASALAVAPFSVLCRQSPWAARRRRAAGRGRDARRGSAPRRASFQTRTASPSRDAARRGVGGMHLERHRAAAELAEVELIVRSVAGEISASGIALGAPGSGWKRVEPVRRLGDRAPRARGGPCGPAVRGKTSTNCTGASPRGRGGDRPRQLARAGAAVVAPSSASPASAGVVRIAVRAEAQARGRSSAKTSLFGRASPAGAATGAALRAGR